MRRLGCYVGHVFGVVLAGAALTGCAPRVDTHGFMPHPELTAQIEPQKQDRNAVALILGSPSTISTFDADTWYYITQKTTNYAFFKPEILDQSVLVIQFGEDGLVSSMEEYTLADAFAVEPVDRKTPTVGKELSIIQQLFGNIGRFSRNPVPPGPGP